MNKTNQHSKFERIEAFVCILFLLSGAIYLVITRRAEEIAAANELAHAKKNLQAYHYDLAISYNAQLRNELLMTRSDECSECNKDDSVPDRSKKKINNEGSNLRINLYTEINSKRIDLSSFKPKVYIVDGRLKSLVENNSIDGEPIRVEDNLFDFKIDEDTAWDLCLTIFEKIEKGNLLFSKLEEREILNTCIQVANALAREDMVLIFRKRMEQ